SSASSTTRDTSQQDFFSGHGETMRGMWLTKVPFFLLQVSYCTSSFRSNNLALVIVPCPRCLKRCVCDCFLVCWLLLCGDVESNPGPATQEMLQTLLDGQACIQRDITEFRDQQTAADKTVNEMHAKFSEIDGILKELREKCSQIDHLETIVTSLRSTVLQQSIKISDLEDRSRRSNLVIFGVAESPNEDEEQLRSKVISDIFADKLGVPCTSIARIHRLGRNGTKRPVIMYFQDFIEKQTVLKNAKKLKGSKVFIQNDYSQSTLHKRKMLWESAKLDKTNGKRVFLVHDKLRINDDFYIWDEDANKRVLLSSASPAQTED
ncbi:unnamed protein product, partial [Ixodes hexagonus]